MRDHDKMSASRRGEYGKMTCDPEPGRRDGRQLAPRTNVRPPMPSVDCRLLKPLVLDMAIDV